VTPLDLAVSIARPGSGSRALLLGPALGTSAAIWDPVLAHLRTDAKVITWDLPGHAGSAPASAPFEVADLAQALADSLGTLGVDSAVAAGVSVGGAVSVELGLRCPETVTDVVMVCSALKLGAAEIWQKRAAMVRAEGTASLQEASSAVWASDAAMDSPLGQLLLEQLGAVDDESYAMLAEAIGRFDARGRAQQLQSALTHLRGAEDGLIGADAADAIRASLPDTSFGVLTGARHIATLDRPADIADRLDHLLAIC